MAASRHDITNIEESPHVAICGAESIDFDRSNKWQTLKKQ
jgi:hypothetical protein